MANTTLMLIDGTVGKESVDSAWPDYAFILAGLYLTIVFIIALIGNSIVIFLFAWDRHLRSPTNMFLLSLTISDWLVTVAGIPFVTSSIYAHRWLFGHVGCMSYAFIMTFLGLNSLMSHAVIAVDRFLVIAKPHFGIVVTYPKAFMMISVPVVFSLSWAVFPLAGWGEYTMEGAGAWCSVRWDSDRADLMAYVLAMMFLTFVASIVVMIYCYVCIFLTMRRMPRWATSNSIKTHERNRRKREVKLLKTLVAIAVVFLAAWSPYAITSMIAIFGHSHLLSVTASTLPSLFAKGSVMMNPIIYATTSRVFRKSFRKMLSAFFPRYTSWLESTKTPSSSTKKTVHYSSDENKKKIVKEDLTSSLLVPGNAEICAAPIAEPPSRVLPEVKPNLSGRRSSAAIEMERLNKLRPGKHKKGRASPGRRESDIGIPDTGYKPCRSIRDEDSSQQNEESETCESPIEGVVEVTENTRPPSTNDTNNTSALGMDDIIDQIHVKYAVRHRDENSEGDKCKRDKRRDDPEKEATKCNEKDTPRGVVLSHDVIKDKLSRKELIDGEHSSNISMNADSGVFDTNQDHNATTKPSTKVNVDEMEC